MAITFICPACRALIENSNINITTDLAKCTIGGAIHKASELVAPVPKQRIFLKGPMTPNKTGSSGV